MAHDERRIDDAQLIDLLWRGDGEPSPRSGLSVGRVVAEAVALADEADLASVSMRKVAERLGVGAMSLYTYVPGRRELVLLMHHRVYGELAPDDVTASWRDRLVAVAEAHWAMYERHPWMLDVPITRSLCGPNHTDRYELELSAVDGIGLDPVEMDATIELIHEHVAGAALRLRGIRTDAEASGISDDEWWHAVLPTLTRVLAGRDYPLSAEVGEAVAAPHLDTTYLMRYGLDRILDGIAHHVADRTG